MIPKVHAFRAALSAMETQAQPIRSLEKHPEIAAERQPP
jgi:hypothetical protein